MKRALSESFAGVPVQEGEPQPFIDSTDVNQSHKLALAVRSLSLELARQKNRRQQSVRNKISFFFLSYLILNYLIFKQNNNNIQTKCNKKFYDGLLIIYKL